MPASQVIIIGILLSLLYVIQQLFFVVLVDELACLLALVCHQAGVSPFFGHRPDLD